MPLGELNVDELNSNCGLAEVWAYKSNPIQKRQSLSHPTANWYLNILAIKLLMQLPSTNIAPVIKSAHYILHTFSADFTLYWDCMGATKTLRI